MQLGSLMLAVFALLIITVRRHDIMSRLDAACGYYTDHFYLDYSLESRVNKIKATQQKVTIKHLVVHKP